MKKDILPVFPTIVGRFSPEGPQTDQVNRDLVQLILEREQGDPGVSVSNVGGWHSNADLLQWNHPSVKVLCEWISEAVQFLLTSVRQLTRDTQPFEGRMEARAWANICRKGSSHDLHNHPDCCWSGVYYLQAGDSGSQGGILELLDPRPFTEMVSSPGNPCGLRVPITPVNGLMITFPSWLYHRVTPYQGEMERISIAFNVSAHYSNRLSWPVPLSLAPSSQGSRDHDQTSQGSKS